MTEALKRKGKTNLKLADDPLATLPEEVIKPGPEVLEELMIELR
jgi:hypothetical protein